MERSDRKLDIVHFRLNGADVTARVTPAKPLLWLLRDDFRLTGAKAGCESGECGACTVLLDGEAIVSCLMMAKQAEGHEVTTIEGLRGPGPVDPVVSAFADGDAAQCGYCTPGFVMATKSLLQKIPSPSSEEERQYLSGNLCRCGNYHRILQAVEVARERSKKQGANYE